MNAHRAALAAALALSLPLSLPAQPRRAPDDDDAALAVVRAAQDDFSRCYEDALARRPGLRLTVELSLSIGPNGRVDAVELTGASADDEPGACLAARARRLLFPRRMAGTRYAVPLDLRPEE